MPMIPADNDRDAPEPPRPFMIRAGRRARVHLDRFIQRFSKVPNDPLLDSATFPWTAALRVDWQTIRAEALAVIAEPASVPPLETISPDHADIAPPGKWRSFFLIGYGIGVPANIARCPVTAGAIAAIPELNTAFFSILAPGAHIAPHRGVTKALMTCHLGLVVPEGPIRMRVADETVAWREGETLVFDDTWEHEVWNDTDAYRVVLLLQFGRPLRAPGRWLAHAFLGMIRRSPFVRDAQANMERWQTSMARIEQEHALDRAA